MTATADRARRVLRAATLTAGAAILAALVARAPAPVRAQTDVAHERFGALTPAERVGQLFLVAFYVPRSYYDGPDADPLQDVRRLVEQYGIGGVVLQKGNNVFRNERGHDLPRELAGLTGALQAVALGDAGPGVPLFVAVDHEGDGDPLTHLREGFTPVPSAMAVGATFDPAHAETVGRIVGSELEAVGVNLLLGPVLDVLSEPRIDSGGDIGTRAFGGDPYWVRQMGTAYIRGVHDGSGGRVATVAKHFPGHGGSDRSTDDEVATVNKPLETLRDIELQPFAAVTSASPGDPDAPGVTDALMTSHIRYRAIHPDVRRVTPPISFDPDGLATLFGMPGFPFASWRDGGGLVVADSLGVRAVRRWFDPSEATFSNRQIARQAFEAGNDVLILAQFAVQPQWSSMLANVEDTMQYFEAQYRTDAAFRAAVDVAALKVVRRKVALYPDWSLDAVAVDPDRAADRIGLPASADAVARVARDAVTVVRALDHPHAGDRVVVVSDFDRRTSPAKLACPTESCGLSDARWEALTAGGATLVEAAILARFGPTGSGVVSSSDIASVTFCQLRDLTGARWPSPTPTTAAAATPGAGPSASDASDCDPPADPESVRRLLTAADWVVFAFADLSPTDVRDLRGLLLPQVGSLVRAGERTRLAVLSLGPPYYVDQTNFFHLDQLIATYSKIPVFVDAGVAALFGELEAVGALPVDYEDADLVLADQLAPDPDQRLALRLVSPREPGSEVLPARFVVEIGPVLDRNGHPVPDGTVFTLAAEPATALVGDGPTEARTASAFARTEVLVGGGGRVSLRGVADEVTTDPLVVDLPVPTPRPSSTSVPATTYGGQPAGHAPRPPHAPGAADLLLALAGIAGAFGAAAAAGGFQAPDPARRAQALLWTAAGGLLGYLGLGTALVLGVWTPRRFAGADAVVVALVGALAGRTVPAVWARVTAVLTATRSRPAQPGTG